MPWTEISFGKHKGKTMPQLLFSDPDYFYWAYENDAFVKNRINQNEVTNIFNKSCNIKIPNIEGGTRVADYYIHPPTGRFSHMQLVFENTPKHEGTSSTIRKDVIDMSVPRQIAPYDKTGCKTLVNNIKFYLFGNERYSMTKKRCEDFFDDDDKFIIEKRMTFF